MFLKGFQFLNEAPSKAGDDVGDDTFEPTEDDAKVKSDSDGDGSDDNDLDFSVGDDPSGDDDEDEEGDNAGEGGEDDLQVGDDAGGDAGSETDPGDEDVQEEDQEPPADPSLDRAKKLRLLKDYDKLLTVTEDLKESLGRIEMGEMSDSEKTFFLELDKTLTESLENLQYVMGSAYLNMQYQKALAVYMYIKSTVTVVSGFLQNLAQLKKQ